MTISQRIFDIMDKKSKKQKELAQYTGISTSAISAWNKNGTNPATEKLSIIADFLDVSVEYLITGKEKSSSADVLSADELEVIDIYNKLTEKSKGKWIERGNVLVELQNEQASTIDKLETRHIALYAAPASAGLGMFLDSSDSESIEIALNDISAQATYALRVRGDSMQPKFYDDDIVLIKSQPNIQCGEIGVFVVNHESYIKKLGDCELISLNSKYENIKLNENDAIYCMGLVLGVVDNH